MTRLIQHDGTDAGIRAVEKLGWTCQKCKRQGSIIRSPLFETTGEWWCHECASNFYRSTPMPSPYDASQGPVSGHRSVYSAVKDSGARQSFDTGAVRDTQDGKPRYDLIPVTALQRLAVHYANGAKKYGDRNWEKGIPRSRCIGSLLRHVFSAIIGDRSEDHWSAVVFNVFCIVHWEETNRKDMLDG